MTNASSFDLFGEEEAGLKGLCPIRGASATDALTQVAPLYDQTDASASLDFIVFSDIDSAALSTPTAANLTAQTAATASAAAAQVPVLAAVATIGTYIADTSPSSGAGRHFAPGSTVTVNLSGLALAGELSEARTALSAWASVANIKFVETTGPGQITLTDDSDNINYNAYTTTSSSSATLLSSASIHITQKWYNTNGGAGGPVGVLNSYGYQTYLHELGHALGLGHAGPYNGSATYGVDNIFTNDSWQYSVMSYFDQTQYGGASFSYISSAMQADIYGIQLLYGASTANNGNTVYGFNDTAGAAYNFSLGARSFCIYDGGGNDSLDCSGFTQSQTINLNSGTFSSVGGLTNNISIAAGSKIETAIGGSGNDTIICNAFNDTLIGGGGNDTLIGGGLLSLTSQQGSIYRLYEATLAREPDLPGFNGWVSALRGGQSLVNIASGFVNSIEFQSTYGNLTNTQFVTRLYNNALSRAPDAAGLSGWVNSLNSGASRASVVVGFSESSEFQSIVALTSQAFETDVVNSKNLGEVYRLYEAALSRAPDVPGFLSWISALDGGQSLASITAGFVNSLEFQSTYGTLNNNQFVTLLYNNVLHRAPDAQGLASWVSALNTGQARTTVVDGFSESAEFQSTSVLGLNTFMQTTFGSTWADTLNGGAGNNVIVGGRGFDTFQYTAGQTLNDQVYGLQVWDHVLLSGFGYSTASQALSHMTQSGSNVVFTDHNETVTFHDTLFATLQGPGVITLA